MTEQWDTATGTRRLMRLRTDDGPIVELDYTIDPGTISAYLSIYDPPQGVSVSLNDLSVCRLRERRGVVNAVARLLLQSASDAALWAAMADVYGRRQPKWALALRAAQAAASAAAETVPTVDQPALAEEIARQALAAQSDG